MANTTSRFGVPLGSEGRGGIQNPKLTYRFRVRFMNFGNIGGGLDLSQYVISASKPNLDFATAQIDSYVSRDYVTGKHTWAPITIVLRDTIDNVAAQLVGYQVQKQTNFFEQTSSAAGINYKFSMFMESLDGGNDGGLDGQQWLDQWICEGCLVQNVTYGDYNYADDATESTITMTIQPANCTQSDGLFEEFPTIIPGTRSS